MTISQEIYEEVKECNTKFDWRMTIEDVCKYIWVHRQTVYYKRKLHNDKLYKKVFDIDIWELADWYVSNMKQKVIARK